MSGPPLHSWMEWDNEHPWSQAEYESVMLEEQRKAYENMTLEDYVGAEEFAHMKAEYEAEMSAAVNQEQTRQMKSVPHSAWMKCWDNYQWDASPQEIHAYMLGAAWAIYGNGDINDWDRFTGM